MGVEDADWVAADLSPVRARLAGCLPSRVLARLHQMIPELGEIAESNARREISWDEKEKLEAAAEAIVGALSTLHNPTAGPSTAQPRAEALDRLGEVPGSSPIAMLGELAGPSLSQTLRTAASDEDDEADKSVSSLKEGEREADGGRDGGGQTGIAFPKRRLGRGGATFTKWLWNRDRERKPLPKGYMYPEDCGSSYTRKG
ncbi:hypothetical protein A0H81_02886 [Grifola frondosa]|uniref:Uncharacterized protein n=1 Tax=Grifola frondosa TaxID=5627 RepID=A0A1C7MN92_GRIFR|nr:hypothetical protein A0H81_02886 [Grifola frondosa]